jgi:hypothetical protein
VTHIKGPLLKKQIEADFYFLNNQAKPMQLSRDPMYANWKDLSQF